MQWNFIPEIVYSKLWQQEKPKQLCVILYFCFKKYLLFFYNVKL